MNCKILIKILKKQLIYAIAIKMNAGCYFIEKQLIM
jgi:hypothetical protein